MGEPTCVPFDARFLFAPEELLKVVLGYSPSSSPKARARSSNGGSNGLEFANDTSRSELLTCHESLGSIGTATRPMRLVNIL